MHLLRRLRGLLGVGLTWGLAWGTVTALLTVVLGILRPGSVGPGEGPLIAGAIIGLQGVVAGTGFGLLVSFAETRKKILDLSLGRVALWGLLASAVLPLVTGMPIGMLWFVGLLGGLSATASVALARSAERRELAQGTSSAPLAP